MVFSELSSIENKYFCRAILKSTPTLTNICLVVVINPIDPPFLFQYRNSPAVSLFGLSNFVNSQVTETKQFNLLLFITSEASILSKILSLAIPSSPPCPK